MWPARLSGSAALLAWQQVGLYLDCVQQLWVHSVLLLLAVTRALMNWGLGC